MQNDERWMGKVASPFGLSIYVLAGNPLLPLDKPVRYSDLTPRPLKQRVHFIAGLRQVAAHPRGKVNHSRPLKRVFAIDSPNGPQGTHGAMETGSATSDHGTCRPLPGMQAAPAQIRHDISGGGVRMHLLRVVGRHSSE